MPRHRRSKSRKSVNRHRKRRSRRFGSKNNCEKSNMLSGLSGLGIGAAAIKLVQEYGSAYVKHTFDEKTRKLKQENEEFKEETDKLRSLSDANGEIITKLEKMYKKATDEAFHSALMLDKLEHLMILLHKYSDIPASDILEIHELYPEDL
jgi:hypothetical protein